MTKKYHTLLIRTPSQLWTKEYGAYDRKDVQDQLDDEKDGDWPKGTKFKIITTGDKQANVNAAVDELNNELTKSASFLAEGVK